MALSLFCLFTPMSVASAAGDIHIVYSHLSASSPPCPFIHPINRAVSLQSEPLSPRLHTFPTLMQTPNLRCMSGCHWC
ncbi:hypothetical protein BDV98DRAFT_564974 [Pterulicium gracile]|uniref:Secreted protein n=1 Tax=Pterulicium gracile TaxID=1884261 RepID=A0A5C3QRG9_9AGAR|nr:hypothetical protein BDV98DRAFT_564974 [Pterula gracilis]